MSTEPSSTSSQPYEAIPNSPPTSPTDSEVRSLPSSDASDSIVSDLEESDAEKEWRESLQQLEMLLTLVLVPYVGKYFGRRCAYWMWGRYMEWQYPVEVVMTSPSAFKGAGAIEAATTL